MKRAILLFIALLAIVACGHKTKETGAESPNDKIKEASHFTVEMLALNGSMLTLKVINNEHKGFAWAEAGNNQQCNVSWDQLRICNADTTTIQIQQDSDLALFDFKAAKEGTQLDWKTAKSVGVWFNTY